MALTDREEGDIRLWFGWGTILGYPTDPRSYLREAMQPKFKAEFLAMPRARRKEILRFVIDEHGRRLKLFSWPWQIVVDTP